MIVNTILEFPEWVFVLCFIPGLVLHVEHLTVCQALNVKSVCLRPPIKHAGTISLLLRSITGPTGLPSLHFFERLWWNVSGGPHGKFH